MTVSPAATSAFEAWTLAQLAARYAEPCPDKVMEYLVDEYDRRYLALTTTPAQTSSDVLLKLFPLLLDMFEPRGSADPLTPHFISGSELHREAFEAIMADLKRLVPPIAVALDPVARNEAI